MMRISKTAILASIFTFSCGANAALIDNTTYVTDDATNIDYLKFSETAEATYNEVVVDDALGFIAQGWQLTSQTTLFALAAADSTARQLINDGEEGTPVVTNNDTVQGQDILPGFVRAECWTQPGVFVLNCNAYSTSGTGYVVSLQRPALVPLPAAGWLFISALVGLVAVKRRKA